jgi:hypothetical protein
MADYARARVAVEYSENSDYSDPVVEKSFESEYTSPTVCEVRRLNVDTDSSHIIDGSTFTSIRSFVLHNFDSTNYVTVSTTNADNAAVAQRVPAGETLRLTDIKAATDITLDANTAACICEYVVVGIS